MTLRPDDSALIVTSDMKVQLIFAKPTESNGEESAKFNDVVLATIARCIIDADEDFISLIDEKMHKYFGEGDKDHQTK